MTALILRPQAKLAASCEAFNAAGLNCVGVGLICTITDLNAIAQLKTVLTEASANTIAIVTSTSAAQIIKQHCLPWPKHWQTIAIGASTAKVLSESDIKAITPKLETSEGALELAILNQKDHPNILIIKGVGGRGILASQLESKGARVIEANIYRRDIVEQPIATRAWDKHEISCIVATSGEIIDAALGYFEPQWIKQLPWIVVSRRLVEFAAKLGINNVIQSDGASDTQIIAAIKTSWSAT